MYADANTALRSDGWIGIDVDAYDGKVGDQTLAAMEAELGELPSTDSSTSRGPEQPSRIWFYRLPEGYEKQRFITKFTDVEIIQHSHRYAVVAPSVHPTTEAPYAWYGYEGEPLDDFPAIDDFEYLPQAWLDRLSLPDVELDEGDGYKGSVQEWLERIPQGTPGLFLSARMAEIPKAAFGHDVLISLQASIVTLAAQGDTGGAEAIRTLRKEWLRGEYNTPDFARAFDAGLESAIAKFGGLPDRPEDILAQDQAAIAVKIRHADFIGLWISKPQVVTAGSLRERVARIMSIAYDEGLSPLEAASLGWHSHAAQDAEFGIRKDGLQAVWDLALHVAGNPVLDEAAFASEPAPEKPMEPKLLPRRKVELLTQREVAQLSTVSWWGDQFMARMRDMHSVISEPYYRTNRWLILSLCFSHRAVISWDDGTTLPLNIYAIALGPSKSGKSEALRPVKEIVKAFWLFDDNPDLGGDATRSALHKKLVERDGKPTMFRSDEADAVIRAWSDNRGPFAGMKQFVTEVYDGEAGAFLRQGDQDDSGKHSKVYMSVHLTGIDEEIADSIEPRDWRSGFINRFIWAMGERKDRTREQKRPRVRRAGNTSPKSTGGDWYATWAAQFQAISGAILGSDQSEPVSMEFTDEVLDRHVDTIETFERLAQNSGYRDRLEPTFGRLETTILKCASLVAITERRTVVEISDYLIALEQTEEWAENILHMVEATDESPRARRAERLFKLILANHGTMPMPKIMSNKAYSGESRDTEGLLHELIQQGRIEELDLRRQGGELIYRVLKQEEK